MGWRVLGPTRSYACATQAGLTRLGAKVMRTSRVVLPRWARRATLVSLLPWCRVLQGLSALPGGPKKPIPIAGAQLGSWNTRRKLSHHVGTFVGSVVSPILANVYLHEFDEFMEQKKRVFDQGKARQLGMKWHNVTTLMRYHRIRIDALKGDTSPEAMTKREGHERKIRELSAIQKRLPSRDPLDPIYRRLFYVRH